MDRDYLDFDIALTRRGDGYLTTASSPGGDGATDFTLPFAPTDLAAFMIAVGPPRVASRRLVPAAARVLDVKDYGARLGDALLAGPVAQLFQDSLRLAAEQGRNLRVQLRLEAVPELDSVPWEYLYDRRLERFLTLSQQTPLVRLIDPVDRPPTIAVEPPLRVLVMISSPSGLPTLAVDREEQLLRATTKDLVDTGQLELVVVEKATLGVLQRALLERVHVFHFIGHGSFDRQAQEGVLALEKEDGSVDRVSGRRLGTLLRDAEHLQLAVLNACEGARTGQGDAFSGVGQALVRQGLPAVVAMQTEISDRAALVFSHEFYDFLTRGLGIDAAMCAVRKAMAVSDEAAEWGTAVLLRSGAEQPFRFSAARQTAADPAQRWGSLYEAAQGALASADSGTAIPMLEQIAAEKPDYADVTALLERVRPGATRPVGGATESETEAETERETERERPAPDVTDHVLTEPIRVVGPATGETHTRPDARPEVAPPPPPPPGSRTTAAPTGGPRSRRRGPRVATMLRVVVAVVVILAVWLGWRVFPSLIQKLPPLVDVACGSPGSDQTPATTFRIGCAAVEPKIDGSFEDWRSVPTQTASAVIFSPRAPQPGLSGRWQALWHKNGLYLHATVVDRTTDTVDGLAPSAWWNGDAVSFEIGPDPRSLSVKDGLRNGRDFHVILGRLTGDSSGAAAAINPAAPQKGVIRIIAGQRRPAITVAARSTGDGYELEALVPWSEVGMTIAPQRGAVLGFNVNISDAGTNHQLATMLSSNPQRSSTNQNHPATWQTVLLADAG